MIAVVAAIAGVWSSFRNQSSVADVALQKQAFPGFDLSLPSGEVKEDNRSYPFGQVKIERVGGANAVVHVSWDGSDLSGDQAGQAFAKGASAARGNAHVELRPVALLVPGGEASSTWEVVVDSTHVFMTRVGCGARQIAVSTAAARGNEVLHRRIIAGFACHPDPASEETIADVPVVFDLGAGWERLKSSPNQLQLTDGKRVVMAHTLAGREENAEKLFEIPGALPGITVGKRNGDHWPFDMNVDGESQRGWLSLLPCPERHLTFVLMWIGAGDEAEARGVLRRTRCRPRGETLQARPGIIAKPGGLK